MGSLERRPFQFIRASSTVLADGYMKDIASPASLVSQTSVISCDTCEYRAPAVLAGEATPARWTVSKLRELFRNEEPPVKSSLKSKSSISTNRPRITFEATSLGSFPAGDEEEVNDEDEDDDFSDDDDDDDDDDDRGAAAPIYYNFIRRHSPDDYVFTVGAQAPDADELLAAARERGMLSNSKDGDDDDEDELTCSSFTDNGDPDRAFHVAARLAPTLPLMRLTCDYSTSAKKQAAIF